MWFCKKFFLCVCVGGVRCTAIKMRVCAEWRRGRGGEGRPLHEMEEEEEEEEGDKKFLSLFASLPI